jgi:uncharacterized damage-inducible protein DinB
MLDFEALREGFQYDRWANGEWLDCLVRKGSIEPDMGILSHVLSAQKAWLIRCQGTSPAERPPVDLTVGTMDELFAGWIEALRSHPDDPVIEYWNFSGVEYRRRMSRIARHVIDHGTYHRGELRGLCLARDDEDFPETGFAGYYMAAGLPE